MNISIFDIMGPVMIGPSSSHTAGAARLAKIAKIIYGLPFSKVRFSLYGSFLKTYAGHGTDKALIAGILGINPDDETIKNSKQIALDKNIEIIFDEYKSDNSHENTAKITFYGDGGEFYVVGSSVGGGAIKITEVNGFPVEFDATRETILINQHDKKGVISNISKILAENGINIAIMKVGREKKGDIAFCVIETDDQLESHIGDKLSEIDNVINVRIVSQFMRKD